MGKECQPILLKMYFPPLFQGIHDCPVRDEQREPGGEPQADIQVIYFSIFWEKMWVVNCFIFSLNLRVFDINDDGTISAKELRRIVKDLFHLLSKVCAGNLYEGVSFKKNKMVFSLILKEDNPEEASQETLAALAFKVRKEI